MASPDRLTLGQLRCVIGCALGLGASVAPGFLAAFGVLAKPMSEDFGWSRGALFVAVTIFSGGGVLLTPVVGLLLDRIGARPIALAGAGALPCVIAGFAALPAAHAAFVSLAAAVAVVGAAANPTIYLSVIVRWFDRRLGMAIAVAMAGLGLGQAMMGLLAQHFLAAFGWRGAWLGVAMVMAVVGLAAFMIVPWRAMPPLPLAERPAARPNVWPVLVRAPLFWTLTAALLLILMIASGVGLNLVAALRDRGLGGLGAASVAAAVPLAAIAGRLLTGALVDRMSYVAIGATLFAGQAIGCVLLANTTSLATTYGAVALIGLGYGAESDLLAFVVKRRFGAGFFGSIYGLMFGLIQIGVMAGPLLAAIAFDRTGSYRLPFMAFGGAAALAAVLWVAARGMAAPQLRSR